MLFSRFQLTSFEWASVPHKKKKTTQKGKFLFISFLQALQEQLTSTVQEIGHLIDPVSTAARGEASQLGHKVCGAGNLF